MSGSLCFWNLCVRKFCRGYISGTIKLLVKGKGISKMFKNLFMTMDYVTFMKWQFAAMASGAALIGTWWLCSKWEKAYEDARNEGVVA